MNVFGGVRHAIFIGKDKGFEDFDVDMVKKFQGEHYQNWGMSKPFITDRLPTNLLSDWVLVFCMMKIIIAAFIRMKMEQFKLKRDLKEIIYYSIFSRLTDFRFQNLRVQIQPGFYLFKKRNRQTLR